MKTQYYTATSLDGFLADEDNSLDWLLQLPDPEGGGSYPDFIRGVGALAMGSTTYEWVQQYGGPWPYTQPAWVFTTRELARIDNADLRFVRGGRAPGP